MCFTGGGWKFPRFLSFWFWPWNQKLRKSGNIYNTCKFQGMCFTWGSWTSAGFPSVRFWPLYWNRKLGKLRNFVLSEFVLFEEVRKQQPPEVFCKKGVLKKFYKFHRKTQVLENTRKKSGLRNATLLKRRLQHWYFPVKFEKFLRTPVLKITSGRLLL